MLDLMRYRMERQSIRNALTLKIDFESATVMTAFNWLGYFIIALTTFLYVANYGNNFGIAVGKVDVATLAAVLGFEAAKAICWYIHYESK